MTWGYGGICPGILAALLQRLLEDITTEPADRASDAAPGLLKLTRRKWPAGTVLSRTLLEAAHLLLDGQLPKPASLVA